MKSYRTRLLAALCVITMLAGLTACGGFSSEKVIRIGYVTPVTGTLAGHGEGCDWAVEQIYDYVRENPIYLGSVPARFEVILYDSKSDPERCRELAVRLAEDDKVDMLIASQTPEMVIPIADVAEEYGIPCISIQAPTDPIAQARDEYLWTFHSFWTLQRVYECYRGLWTAAGFPPGSGAQIGLLFANDADGTAWHDLFLTNMREDGYVPIDPGQYDVGADDFSPVVKAFTEQKPDIITGTNQPPDFINSMNALREAGVTAECITMGKCCPLESDAAGMSAYSNGLLNEVWWTPSDDNISELTGISGRELNRRYTEENFDRTLSSPAAYAYAALEIAVHTFNIAGTTNKRAVRNALSAIDVNTIVGPIRYDKIMNGLHYGETLLGGGQWQFENGMPVLKTIDNSLYPEIPTDGVYKPGNVLSGPEDF